MTSHIVADIHNLTIHFSTIDGIVKVLERVSLRVAEGEIVGIVGETGCGKSVTTKALLGILSVPPAKIIDGHIRFLGQDLFSLSKKERNLIKQKLGYIPQDPMSALNPVFTIREAMVDNIVWRRSSMNLRRYLYQRRKKQVCRAAEKRVIESLRKVNIPDPEAVLHKYPIELSGGMKQRVLIASALLGNPEMLIADEPTTALDVTVQKVILRILSEKIQEEHLSGLYITHDLGVARAICDRTYVMYAGAVVEMAKTTSLLDNPLHPYTRGLVDSIPKMSGEDFEGIPGTVPDYYNPPRGCRFCHRCCSATKACAKESPEIREVEEGHMVACRLF